MPEGGGTSTNLFEEFRGSFSGRTNTAALTPIPQAELFLKPHDGAVTVWLIWNYPVVDVRTSSQATAHLQQPAW